MIFDTVLKPSEKYKLEKLQFVFYFKRQTKNDNNIKNVICHVVNAQRVDIANIVDVRLERTRFFFPEVSVLKRGRLVLTSPAAHPECIMSKRY